jgi:tetratricopeptide (TPR) repeat protein
MSEHNIEDPMAASCVPSAMAALPGSISIRHRGAFACWLLAAACGGGGKQDNTTPEQARPAESQSMNDPGGPEDAATDTNPGGGGTIRMPGPRGPGGAAGTAGGAGPGGPAGGDGPGGPAGGVASEPPAVTMPNYDPDPAQARTQVDQHLQVARAALSTASPDPETALREARLALSLDAASIDAAAMVAFAYYHKKLYDTAELVLDDLFKREAAKQNANVYYVYGLVYDRTSRPDQAVLSFKRTVELNPNHTSALINLGVHQLRNSQYGEALATFERLVNQFGRSDAVTLTSLGSAYRGHAADYPASARDRGDNVRKAEAAYKRALQANSGYGPAYYNLGLLYLDNDPFPGLPDTLVRLNTSKSYFEQYKNMPNVDMKLYDDRLKDVTKAIKRAEKQMKKSAPKRGNP